MRQNGTHPCSRTPTSSQLHRLCQQLPRDRRQHSAALPGCFRLTGWASPMRQNGTPRCSQTPTASQLHRLCRKLPGDRRPHSATVPGCLHHGDRASLMRQNGTHPCSRTPTSSQLRRLCWQLPRNRRPHSTTLPGCLRHADRASLMKLNGTRQCSRTPKSSHLHRLSDASAGCPPWAGQHFFQPPGQPPRIQGQESLLLWANSEPGVDTGPSLRCICRVPTLGYTRLLPASRPTSVHPRTGNPSSLGQQRARHGHRTKENDT